MVARPNDPNIAEAMIQGQDPSLAMDRSNATIVTAIISVDSENTRKVGNKILQFSISGQHFYFRTTTRFSQSDG